MMGVIETMSLGAVFTALRENPDRGVALPPNWMQGRTVYGGLSASLALNHVRARYTDLPALRSVQIAFVAPMSGPIHATAQLLRQGRSASYIQVDLYAGEVLGLRAFLLFCADRPSRLQQSDHSCPMAPDPDHAHIALKQAPSEHFTSHFEYRHALPLEERHTPVLRRWCRLRDREGVSTEEELLVIGDGLPPAAAALLKQHAPLSSMNWSINFLDQVQPSRDGWWLLENRAVSTGNGISAQRMRVWDRDGQSSIDGMQSVAIFD